LNEAEVFVPPLVEIFAEAIAEGLVKALYSLLFERKATRTDK